MQKRHRPGQAGHTPKGVSRVPSRLGGLGEVIETPLPRWLEIERAQLFRKLAANLNALAVLFSPALAAFGRASSGLVDKTR